MYDLDKIIIIGKWEPDDKENLQTLVLCTSGMKITSLLYLDDHGSIKQNKDEVISNLKSELYDDQYEDDELVIKAKEVMDGHDAISKIAKFIKKNWTEDTLLYFFEPTENAYNKLTKELLNTDGRIYLSDYYDIFVDKKDIEKNIFDIMKEQGLKTENMLKDSYVSKAYFLSALVEKIINK